MSDKRLKKALEPFLRAYRVSIEPFPDADREAGLRGALPGVWPTVGNLEELFKAAQAAGLDYKRGPSKKDDKP